MANQPQGGAQNDVQVINNDEAPKPAIPQRVKQRA